jgi:hypothetical protein
MAVRVQTYLHERLRHGTLAIRNEGVFQNPFKVALCGGLKPRGLLRLITCISSDECVERGRGARLVFVNKRQPEHGEQPEPIGEQDMVEQLPQLGVGCCRAVLPNGIQQCSIRVSFVSDQITQHLQHARHPITDGDARRRGPRAADEICVQRRVLLFSSAWELQYFERQNPTIALLAESPIGATAVSRN